MKILFVDLDTKAGKAKQTQLPVQLTHIINI